MALARLARQAAVHLRRGGVPARAFEPLWLPPPALGRLPPPPQSVLSRYASPSPSLMSPAAFQARATKSGAFSSLAARAPLRARPQLSGLKLLKGFGTGTALAMTLYPWSVASAEAERPADRLFEEGSKGKLGYSKQDRRQLWSLLRKCQLPIGLIVLIALGWQNLVGVAVHILLLLYSSRPDPYSIYLHLQEIHQKNKRQHPAFWIGEYLPTRKVDAEDYKFFTVGTVELQDKTILHVIGILGGWWTYRVSYAK